MPGDLPNTIMMHISRTFYVSYNDVDIAVYGSVTTALVQGQMQRFFILRGDHRRAYLYLFNRGGFEACYKYYLSEPEKHPYSDTSLLPRGVKNGTNNGERPS